MLSLELCPFCNSDLFVLHQYRSRPEGETDFHLPEPYYRELRQCYTCGHIFNVHRYDLSELYEGGYGKATYGDINKVKNEFNRIQQLPSYRSDNAGRVRFVEQKWFEDKVPVTGPYPLRGSLLDIGSGLGIFPHAMAIRGWRAICVESDPLLVDNLNDLDLIAFEDTWPSDGPTSTLDLITFNKVLEHVEDPVAFLSHARPYCHKNSIVYIEVPSISAARVNFGREEFFIEHHHVFSAASVALLASKAGFQLKELYDIVEPSGKYTIRVVMGV